MNKLFRILCFVLLGLSFFDVSAYAAKSCDKETFKTARRDFKKLYDQKKYIEAVKTLKTSIDGCYHPADDSADEYCWAQSDFALGLLKSGDAQGCRDKLASIVVPNINCPCCGASEDYGKNASAAEKAALHNYELCEAAIAQDLKKFKTTPCPLKLPLRALSSTLIPSDKASKDGTECLVLVGSEYGKDFYLGGDPKLQAKFDKDPQIFCSQLSHLTRKSAESKNVQSKILSAGSDDEILGGSEYCCKLDQIGVSNENGQLFVRVFSSDGPSQPCGGSGTARATSDGIYQLENDKLILKTNLSWGTH